LEHRAHRAARDDAGAGRRRAQEDLAGAVPSEDVMMQRTALAQRHAGQAALGCIGCLADRFRHLARLAVPESDPALLITYDDECSEAETTAALDHLGHAVDVHQLVDELAVALLAATAFSFPSRFPCHLPIPFASSCPKTDFHFSGMVRVSLKVESAFTRGVCQRLDTSVI